MRKNITDRLQILKEHVDDGNILVMILGLGSVGAYLLDYLANSNDPAISVVVVGRNREKIESDVNIVKVAGMIRGKNKSSIMIEADVDFDHTSQLAECIKKYKPDFIVNSSRVYSGLKYGSISWKNLRAYGIWAPLAIKYMKNIMEACEEASSDAIVINTSYSDAVIPWLHSANMPYPDFGSGNINHLLPRIKLALAQKLQITDSWNIEIVYATSHFHDVVISKEGQTEGVEQLIEAYYKEEKIEADWNEIFRKCKISMPTDAKRNMMNASSNYDIIEKIISAIRKKSIKRFHSPGALGEIGGYPVIVDASRDAVSVYIDESKFDINLMRSKNRESIALDGIENVENGALIYTDDLIAKVKKAFGEELPKTVSYEEIDKTADFLIKHIIENPINREKA